MLPPPNAPIPMHHEHGLTRLASEVTGVATPILAAIGSWMGVINSGLALVASLGGIYLLYINIKRARRLDREDRERMKAPL